MTEPEFDELVRRALLQATEEDFRPILEAAPEFSPSPRYLAWEKKLLADPFGFAKKQARPRWKKALRAAACFVLAAGVLFGGVMAVSPDARAWVRQTLVQWYDSFARFTFSGGTGRETGAWETTYLPQGFRLTEENVMSVTTDVTYEDEKGEKLYFTYLSASAGSFGVDNEHHEYEVTEIGGAPAYLLRATTPEERSQLIWLDEESGTVFKLMSEIDSGELIQIARGIRKK